MQIDDLAGNTVKITLEPSDMSGYHIKSEDISGHSHSAELALSRLISCLSEDHGLKLCGERLLVEAFPKSNGGCILYISCLKGTQKNTDRSSRNNEIVCTGSVNELAALCKALKRSSHKSASLLLHYRQQLSTPRIPDIGYNGCAPHICGIFRADIYRRADRVRH